MLTDRHCGTLGLHGAVDVQLCGTKLSLAALTTHE
jgi:hypothetical protein